MKLLRYGPAGGERPGLLDADGQLRDLSAHVADLGPRELAPAVLARLRAIDAASLPRGRGRAAPRRRRSRHRQVHRHRAQLLRPRGRDPDCRCPAEPVVFTKATSCISGPNDDVMIPRGSVKTDWEVELGVVIGTARQLRHRGRRRSRTSPATCVVNDVSEREFQIERGGTWDKGKGCDTFGPLGPWLVTADEVADPQALSHVAGRQRRAQAERHHRHHDLRRARTWSATSAEFMTLCPGDVITTGTPPGVGMGLKPPHYLKAGDVDDAWASRGWASSSRPSSRGEERTMSFADAIQRPPGGHHRRRFRASGLAVATQADRRRRFGLPVGPRPGRARQPPPKRSAPRASASRSTSPSGQRSSARRAETVERLGGIDVLVASAGITGPQRADLGVRRSTSGSRCSTSTSRRVPLQRAVLPV